MAYFHGGCVLAMAFVMAFVAADGSARRCYACSDIACNDPFNISQATIINCSNPASYRSTGSSEWDEVENKIFTNWNSLNTDTDNFVCYRYSMHVGKDNTTRTIRGCFPKSVGDSTVCNEINQTVILSAGRIMDCSSCDTDLCNTGISFKSSLLTICILLGSFLIQARH